MFEPLALGAENTSKDWLTRTAEARTPPRVTTTKLSRRAPKLDPVAVTKAPPEADTDVGEMPVTEGAP